MPTFQQVKDYEHVFLEDTDKPLPETLNPNTRYMFLRTVAKGGKSIINACRDTHLNRIVAYKSLRPEFINDAIENTRLLREARVSAMLQHPNTMPIYEVSRDSHGHLYFTMKLVHGYTLREIMDYRERYDLTQLIEVFEQIVQCLAYAHDHGVAHRDIKPENILAGPYGEVLLLDWGLAKVWNKDGSALFEDVEEQNPQDVKNKSMTGQGNLQGSICYMSPEQIRRDPDISFSTDIYSMGSVLYEILTGQPPFDSDAAYEILDMIQNKEATKPSEISKYPVPRILERLCLKCLNKDPAARPASMDEVLQILQQDWATDLKRK